MYVWQMDTVVDSVEEEEEEEENNTYAQASKKRMAEATAAYHMHRRENKSKPARIIRVRC